MRAITFLNTSAQRGVVAFRGTDTNVSGISGQMDMCADAILSGTPLESYCYALPSKTQDYFATALVFTDDLALMYPDTDWLFTGHSTRIILLCSAQQDTGLLRHGPGLHRRSGTHVPRHGLAVYGTLTR